MKYSAEYLEAAERLDVIAKRVGFALWQLQELENVAAQCFVLLAQAVPGMGEAAAAPLLDAARSKTFGQTCRLLVEAKLLSADLESALRKLLLERNWLVHDSRLTNRAAVHNDVAMRRLLKRVDAIPDAVSAVMPQLAALAQAHAARHGVSKEFIDQHTAALLAHWHLDDAT
jgi:uncharacterized protein YutE (UPF0331/DUF86 family)